MTGRRTTPMQETARTMEWDDLTPEQQAEVERKRADRGRVPTPDEAADELCAVLTSMDAVGTQHDDAVIVSRSHYERWQRQIGRALLTLDDYSEEPTP